MSGSCSAVSCLQSKHTEHTRSHKSSLVGRGVDSSGVCTADLASVTPGQREQRVVGLLVYLCVHAPCRHDIAALSVSLPLSTECWPCSVLEVIPFTLTHANTHIPPLLYSHKHSSCQNPPLPKYKTEWPHLERLKQRGQTVNEERRKPVDSVHTHQTLLVCVCV